ncbi:MAG: NAD-dependent epimerase/dehydratase family protein [Bacteroidetes bacterium]|nr:NAD-dependent epimerase/dehydratase family protein [Bacteroidota bacterium]
MKVLVTGANGFVGRHLCRFLINHGYEVIAGRRSSSCSRVGIQATMYYGDIGPETVWDNKLHGIDVIVHLASRVHIVKETSTIPLDAFRAVNTDGTQQLLLAASQQRVKKFLFLSSIGVNGCETTSSPFTENDTPQPHNAYAQSKWEAEQKIHKVMKHSNMNCIIIRPPLVYGPDVVANFLFLLRIMKTGVPLPLGAIKNLRSYISVDNLVDFITFMIVQDEIKNETYLISDDDDISTPELLQCIAGHMRKKIHLFPVPLSLLHFGGLLLNKANPIHRLCSSLQIDITKAKMLGWRPPITLPKGVEQTAHWYLKR